MKPLRNLKIYFILFWSMATFNSCDFSNEDQVSSIDTSIIDVLQDDPNLSSLLAAIEATAPNSNIFRSLSSVGTYTLLAPNNEAFDTFLNGRALADIPANELEQLLFNHILFEPVDAATFIGANENEVFYTKTAAFIVNNNQRFFLNIYFDSSTNRLVFNNQSTVIDADNAADNGIVHVVDKVIALPTMVDLLSADSRFSTLHSALTNDTQVDFASILSTPLEISPAPFTVFAPTNEAFMALAVIPSGEDLAKVLQHHVIPNASIQSSQITNGLESPATLEGDILIFSIQNNMGFIQDGIGNTDARLITGNLNIQAKNGVIHAIDKVLFPNTDN